MIRPGIHAGEIARALESDPVAAAQVKEYLTPARLCELLDLDMSQYSDDEIMHEYFQRFPEKRNEQ
jgi:hypothetical protein